MKNTNIKYTVLAFVLGVGMAIGSTVYGKLSIGSSTDLLNKDGTKKVIVSQSEFESFYNVKNDTIDVSNAQKPVQPNTFQITPEEARLRSIEARLTVLENK